MIYLKTFEGNQNQERTFIVNDLIDYYNKRDYEIYNFLLQFITIHSLTVQFYCKHCTEEINDVTNYKHSNKIHKGIIYGCGYDYAIDNRINFIYY